MSLFSFCVLIRLIISKAITTIKAIKRKEAVLLFEIDSIALAAITLSIVSMFSIINSEMVVTNIK